MLRVLKNTLLVLVCLALVVPAALLVTGVLPYRIFVVHTGSMTPTIPSRSAVVVREGAYRVGQVISFESPNGIVTHRLIARTSQGLLTTKGDANRTADPGSTAPSQVIGGVIFAPPMVGYWLVYLKNPAGAASLLLTVVCVWLIFSIMGDLAKRQSKTAKTEAAPTTAPASETAPPGQADKKDRETGPRLAPRPALVLNTEPPTRVWRAVPKQPLAFRCSHCQAVFGSNQDLRKHSAIHGTELINASSADAAVSLGKPKVVWAARARQPV